MPLLVPIETDGSRYIHNKWKIGKWLLSRQPMGYIAKPKPKIFVFSKVDDGGNLSVSLPTVGHHLIAAAK